MIYRPTKVTISASAIRHNLKRVKTFAPNSKVIAIIKANAYGHGFDHILAPLSEVGHLGVHSIDDAIILREKGCVKPIMLLSGFRHDDEITEIQKYDLTPVIHSVYQLDLLAKHTLDNVSVWLKIDTGMHRLGFAADEMPEVYKRVAALKGIASPLGMMTHFAQAQDHHIEHSMNQFAMYQAALGPQCRYVQSAANSAAIMTMPETHLDYIRPGIMLYGLSPFADATGVDHGLMPAMTLSSNIISIKTTQVGDKIGYSGKYVCKRPMRIGIVPIGYGDGYPRDSIGEHGIPVLVDGVPSYTLGFSSMDMIAVDLSHIESPHIDMPVTLWGPELPIETVAKACGMSQYVLPNRITTRVPYVSVD